MRLRARRHSPGPPTLPPARRLTIIVVADFLLAASLTVRHGLPGHRRLRLLLSLLLLLLPPRLRRGEKKAGAKVEGGSPAGKGRPEGGEEGGAGRAGYRPAEGPRARTRGWQRRQLATLGRGRGAPNYLRRPRGGGAGPLRLHGGGGGKRLLQFGKRGFLMMSNLHRTATLYSRKRTFFLKSGFRF